MDLQLPDRTDAGWERHRIVAVAVVFAVIALLAAVDLVGDLREGTTLRHALVEGAIVLAGAVGVGMLILKLTELGRRERDALAMASGLARDLAESCAEAERWRAEAAGLLRGLGALIDRQLTRWGLTSAEKEVALLLLKGLSHREVAAVRDVSEATARQQATAVYRKAGLSGRHDLAAFFLEDLLSPRSRE